MKVTSTLLPNSQAKLTIELDVEEIQSYVDAAAKRISQEVEIKGFRKGKVPYDILIQHVGESSIYEEAFSDVVEATYPKAVDQEKLQVVGRAQIDVEKLAPGNPVVYTATVPLMPKVVLGDYKKLKAKKKAVELDEKKYEQTLNDLRRMRAKEKLVKRPAVKGDTVLIDFVVKVDGVPIEGGTAQKHRLELGSGQMIPGFEEQVEGMKTGDEKDFTLNFPKEYKKDLAGKEANFHITMHDVYEMELPELNDEFAKEVNFESLEKMQEEIKANIMKELEQEVRQEFEVAIIDEIMEKSTFDELAPQMIEEEVDKMVRELEQEIAQRGLKFDDYLTHIGQTQDELKKGFEEKAAKRIKAALVMREVAVGEDVKADASEIEKEIEEMKKVYAHIPEAAAYLDSPQQRAQMENNLIHRKVFDLLESLTK